MLIVGALCAALMISGGWLNRGAAALAAAWFVYAKWVFTVDLYWQN